MKNKIFLTLLLLNLWAIDGHSQYKDIITALIDAKKIDARFPIIDSLRQIDRFNWKSEQKEMNLSKREVKSLAKCCYNAPGIKLTGGFITRITVIPSDFFFKAIKTADSSDLKRVNEKKPFYALSSPLIFNNGEDALIEVFLIGSQGISYWLHREQGKWIIKAEYMRFVV